MWHPTTIGIFVSTAVALLVAVASYQAIPRAGLIGWPAPPTLLAAGVFLCVHFAGLVLWDRRVTVLRLAPDGSATYWRSSFLRPRRHTAVTVGGDAIILVVSAGPKRYLRLFTDSRAEPIPLCAEREAPVIMLALTAAVALGVRAYYGYSGTWRRAPLEANAGVLRVYVPPQRDKPTPTTR